MREEMQMGETVYADVLFMINFSMDFLCFYICSRVLGHPLSPVRTVIASAMGGIYSVAILYFDPGGAAELLLDIAVLLLMCAVARPRGSPAARLGGAAMYAGVSAALGGFMTAVFSLANRAGLSGANAGTDTGGEVSAWVFALVAAAGAAASVIGGRRLGVRTSGGRVRVKVFINGKHAEFDGMIDSGNLLSDPLSGRRIMICELEALAGIIDPATAAMVRAGGISSRMTADAAAKVRFIPASGALGDGLVCAITPDEVIVTDPESGRECGSDVLVAPVPRRLSADGCRALLPPGAV